MRSRLVSRRSVAVLALMAAAVGLGHPYAVADQTKSGEKEQGRREICLAENGRSDYAIVVAKDAPAPVKFAAEELQKYEYYTFSEQQKIWSMVSVIGADIGYFQRLGVRGISSDQWGPGWYPLNMYAFGKLAWNPQLKPEELIDDFCAKYYGRAGRTMAAYWNLLEQSLRESWTTQTAIDWRDAQRRELLQRGLSDADDKTVADRIRAAAALHKLTLAP